MVKVDCVGLTSGSSLAITASEGIHYEGDLLELKGLTSIESEEKSIYSVSTVSHHNRLFSCE